MERSAPPNTPRCVFFPLFLPRDPPPPAPRFRDGETEGQRGGATCPPRSPPGDRVQSAPVQSRTLLSHSPHATSSSWLGGTCRLLTSLCLVPSSPLGAPGIPASGPAPPDGHRAGPQLRDGSGADRRRPGGAHRPASSRRPPTPTLPLPRPSPPISILFGKGPWGRGLIASLVRNSRRAFSQTELVDFEVTWGW